MIAVYLVLLIPSFLMCKFYDVSTSSTIVSIIIGFICVQLQIIIYNLRLLQKQRAEQKLGLIL